MRCVGCRSSVTAERPERTAGVAVAFVSGTCGKRFEGSGGAVNRGECSSDLVRRGAVWSGCYRRGSMFGRNIVSNPISGRKEQS
jgi:hypothetical protein